MEDLPKHQIRKRLFKNKNRREMLKQRIKIRRKVVAICSEGVIVRVNSMTIKISKIKVLMNRWVMLKSIRKRESRRTIYPLTTHSRR